MLQKTALGTILALLGYTVVTAQQDCINGTIRTVTDNGNDFIQYCSSNEWRLHCTGGGSPWRNQEIDVACTQLGYDGREGGPMSESNPGMALTDKFFRFQGQCRGGDQRVDECGTSGGVQELDSCTTEHGLAICKPFNCDNEENRHRLVDGTDNNEGRVEVCINGRWGTVCNNQEGLAGAVCARLEYSPYRATVDSFTPSAAPSVNCAVQPDEIDTLQCTTLTGSCDVIPSLGVVCRTHEEVADLLFTEIVDCETERNQTVSVLSSNISVLNQVITDSSETINILNDILEECRENTTIIVQTCQNNITRISNELQECLIATTESLALSKTAITPAALGAVIGLLVVVLMIAVVGWIVTCVKLARFRPSSKNTAEVCTVQNESYFLQQAVHDEATPTQDTYSSLGPTYDVLNHNQQAPPTVQPRPTNATPAGASKQSADFYDAEKYTYAMVDKKPKRKNNVIEKDSHVYEMAMDGETSWGVQEGQEGYSKLKR